MGKVYEQLDDSLIGFIERQHVFFVGTAPTSPEGHLNLSPKGLDTFRILGPKSVAYLDLTGSGIETVAHLRENGRLTIMFCAFEGRPATLRRTAIPGSGNGEAPGRGGRPQSRAGRLPEDGAGHPARDGQSARPVPEARVRRDGPLLGQPDRADDVPGKAVFSPEGLTPMSIRRGRR